MEPYASAAEAAAAVATCRGKMAEVKAKLVASVPESAFLASAMAIESATASMQTACGALDHMVAASAPVEETALRPEDGAGIERAVKRRLDALCVPPLLDAAADAFDLHGFLQKHGVLQKQLEPELWPVRSGAPKAADEQMEVDSLFSLGIGQRSTSQARGGDGSSGANGAQSTSQPTIGRSDGGSLLDAARACVPADIRILRGDELRLSEATPREQPVVGGFGDAHLDRSPSRQSVELRIEGVLVAVVDCVVSEEAAGIWVPRRVGIGPSHEPMPFGAATPPSMLVFAELTARAGAILCGLDALPPARRLRPLISWLASLHDLFECVCVACGEVFPPAATEGAQLVPPCARGPGLEPYHPECFHARFGCGAEESFLEEVARSVEALLKADGEANRHADEARPQVRPASVA